MTLWFLNASSVSIILVILIPIIKLSFFRISSDVFSRNALKEVHCLGRSNLDSKISNEL